MADVDKYIGVFIIISVYYFNCVTDHSQKDRIAEEKKNRLGSGLDHPVPRSDRADSYSGNLGCMVADRIDRDPLFDCDRICGHGAF